MDFQSIGVDWVTPSFLASGGATAVPIVGRLAALVHCLQVHDAGGMITVRWPRRHPVDWM
jgi:hypothetical protein